MPLQHDTVGQVYEVQLDNSPAESQVPLEEIQQSTAEQFTSQTPADVTSELEKTDDSQSLEVSLVWIMK